MVKAVMGVLQDISYILLPYARDKVMSGPAKPKNITIYDSEVVSFNFNRYSYSFREVATYIMVPYLRFPALPSAFFH